MIETSQGAADSRATAYDVVPPPNDSVLHRGLPFEGAERIMFVERSNPTAGIEQMPVSIHMRSRHDRTNRYHQGVPRPRVTDCSARAL